MIPDPHSRRFDPSLLSPVIGTDGAELSGAPRSGPVGVPTDAALEQFDAALEQIVNDGRRTCPLCGLIAGRDGSSLN
jgi:hypothetical protein